MSEHVEIGTQSFRISSGLKNIIGKDLITNDYIAVFELIKNSYDANASRVDVIFDHEGVEGDKPNIIIKDDGEGMNFEDIKNKWLFVAYSAKREEKDYRDAISNKRIQAGAKGIGRFSCDKLGTELTIYTKKKEEKKTHMIKINWDDFEEDSQQQFSEIEVEYKFIESDKIDTPSGTVLEISGTREHWDRNKLIRLRQDLAKLINPNKKYGEDDNFSIFLFSSAEEETDKKEKKNAHGREKYMLNIVNGEVTNPLFDDIKHRTVSLHAEVIDDGKYIKTELRDNDVLIYRIKEVNTDFEYDGEKLKNIQISLLYLDKGVRSYITRRSGSKDAIAKYFGFVSLYRNGFRIYPFGELGDDSLGIDYRYTQGYNRYLPNRSMIGRIEIFDGKNNFVETSSRDGGLIKNHAYSTLVAFFFSTLKKFEKYVVSINIRKNFPEIGNTDFSNEFEIKSKITELLSELSGAKSVVDIEYDEKVFDILEQKSEESLQRIFKNFERIAIEKKDDKLLKTAKEAEKRLKELSSGLQEAEVEMGKKEEEIQSAEVKIKEANAETERRVSQNHFLESLVGRDLENVTALHHDISKFAASIENKIRKCIRKIKKGEDYSSEDFMAVFEKISFLTSKIHAITQFATKANFNVESKNQVFDICNFIHEYITHVGSDILKERKIKFHYENPKEITFNIKAMHVEIAMLLDNLINNAEKAKANNIYVRIVAEAKNYLEIEFLDDGIGIPIGKEKTIFELGYTTTKGTGLGLPHVSQILKEIGGTIVANSETLTCFKIRIEND